MTEQNDDVIEIPDDALMMGEAFLAIIKVIQPLDVEQRRRLIRTVTMLVEDDPRIVRRRLTKRGYHENDCIG